MANRPNSFSFADCRDLGFTWVRNRVITYLKEHNVALTADITDLIASMTIITMLIGGSLEIFGPSIAKKCGHGSYETPNHHSLLFSGTLFLLWIVTACKCWNCCTPQELSLTRPILLICYVGGIFFYRVEYRNHTRLGKKTTWESGAYYNHHCAILFLRDELDVLRLFCIVSWCICVVVFCNYSRLMYKRVIRCLQSQTSDSSISQSPTPPPYRPREAPPRYDAGQPSSGNDLPAASNNVTSPTSSSLRYDASLPLSRNDSPAASHNVTSPTSSSLTAPLTYGSNSVAPNAPPSYASATAATTPESDPGLITDAPQVPTTDAASTSTPSSESQLIVAEVGYLPVVRTAVLATVSSPSHSEKGAKIESKMIATFDPATTKCSVCGQPQKHFALETTSGISGRNEPRLSPPQEFRRSSPRSSFFRDDPKYCRNCGAKFQNA